MLGRRSDRRAEVEAGEPASGAEVTSRDLARPFERTEPCSSRVGESHRGHSHRGWPNIDRADITAARAPLRLMVSGLAWTRLRGRSGQRLQLLQQGRHQLAHGRVDVPGARDDCVGLLGRHHIQQRMHDLIAVEAKDRSAQQQLRVGIDDARS